MILGALALWLCAGGCAGIGAPSSPAGSSSASPRWRATTGSCSACRSRWRSCVSCAPQSRSGQRLDRRLSACVGAVRYWSYAPWLYRQLEVLRHDRAFGRERPHPMDHRLQQLFSVAAATTRRSVAAAGNRLGSSAAGSAGCWPRLGLFALLPLAVVLTPFAVIGAWVRRRDPWFVPSLIYASRFSRASGLALSRSTCHTAHSFTAAVALLPHTFVLVVVGVGGAVRWVADGDAWDARRGTPCLRLRQPSPWRSLARSFSQSTTTAALVAAREHSDSSSLRPHLRRQRAEPTSSCPPTRAPINYLTGPRASSRPTRFDLASDRAGDARLQRALAGSRERPDRARP